MGADCIHNTMLKRLSPKNQAFLCHMFNIFLANSFVPDSWKTACVLPFLKPGKPALDAASYRPISLTSCLCKAMEKILAQRLQWFLDEHKILPPSQAGFRHNRSVLDNLIFFDHAVKSSFSNGLSSYGLFLDINKAYDSTWTQGLVFKLASIGISGPMLGWFHSFLTDRSLIVRLGNFLSHSHILPSGVPQGSVLSPLLFNVMLHDFPLIKSPGTTLLYADDISVLLPAYSSMEASTLLQSYLNEVSAWCTSWRFSMAAAKCSLIVFSRKRKPDAPVHLYLDGQLIPQVDQVKFLGLIFDSKLSWKQHINYVVNKCVRLKSLFYQLTKVKSGPSLSALITFYKLLVRSHIDFGLPIYGSASKSLLSKLDIIQNQFLRLILGSAKSTPVPELYIETGIESIALRAQWLSSKYVLKLGHQPSHPNYPIVTRQWQQPQACRPKSTPCLTNAVNFLKDDSSLSFNTLSTHTPPTPWSNPNFESSYLPISKQAALLTAGVANNLFLSVFNSLPPTSLSVFCDGSLSQQHSRTSAAFFIPQLNMKRSWTLTVGTSILSAELSAIDGALLHLYRCNHKSTAVYIFSDSQSAITLLQNDYVSHPIASNIINTIDLLKQNGSSVSIMWIPSHVGICFNEQVDSLARSENEQPTSLFRNPLSLTEKITLTKRRHQSVFDSLIRKTPTFQIKHKKFVGPAPWLIHPSRKISIVLHRLRTGHNGLGNHRSRFDPDVSPLCRLGCSQRENAQHILIDCPRLVRCRAAILRLFSHIHLPLTLENLLGLHPSLSCQQQLIIRNALTTYLINCNLIDSI